MRQVTADDEAVGRAFAALVAEYPDRAVELALEFSRYWESAVAVNRELGFACCACADSDGNAREYVCPAIDFLFDTGEQPDMAGVKYAEAVAALEAVGGAPFRA